MSNQYLKLRRSSVPSKTPDTGSLDFGELALNTYDGIVFMKKSGSLGEEVIRVGGESINTGSFATTGSNRFNGDQTITGSLSIKNSGSLSPISIYNTSSFKTFEITPTGQFIINRPIATSGQTVNVYANQNGSDGMYFQNDNKGSSAGIQLLMGNDKIAASGSDNYFQIYKGSMNNYNMPDGTQMVEYGAGGIRIASFGRPSTAPSSSGPISFAIGGIGSVNEIAWVNHPSYLSDFTVKNNINILSGSLRIFNGNINVTGSIIVTNGITGSISSASFASTASFVNPLRQVVIITGSLQLSASAASINNIGGTTYLGSILGIGADSGTSFYPNDRHFIRATVRTDVPYTYGFLQSYSVPGGGFQPLRIEGLPIIFSTNTTSYFDTDGNLGISNISWLGGTPASSSYPILPSKLYVKGAGSGSATTSLLVQNSSLSSSLIVLDNGNIGIGTTTPTASLHIKGAGLTDILITEKANGTGSFKIYADGSVSNTPNGTNSGNEAFGISALLSASNASGANTAMGVWSLKNTTLGQLNVAIGYTAGAYGFGFNSSTYVGGQAGRFAGTGSDFNVGIGRDALGGSTTPSRIINDPTQVNYVTGIRNTAVGTSALTKLVSGQRNNALGDSTLSNNVSGSYNTANGNRSIFTLISGDYNTALGYDSLFTINSSSYNTGIGTQALRDVTTGDKNISLGFDSGRNITTGRANLILGSVTGLSASLSNNIILADGDGNIRAQYSSSLWNISSSLTLSGSLIVTGEISGSITNAISSSYAATASYADNFTVAGTITAQKLVVQQVTSSILYSSGSNQFGSQLTDIQSFTGSLQITGSINATGNIVTTGSLNIRATTGQNLFFNTSGQIGSSGTGTHITISPSTNTTILSQVVTTNNGLNVTPGGNSTTAGLTVTSGSYPAATLLRVGVNSLVVTGSNVGIGTSSPSTALDVYDGTAGNGIRITRSTVPSQYIELIPNNSTESTLISGGGNLKPFVIANRNDLPLHLATGGTGIINAKLTISGSNVGIGTISPSASLHIKGATSSSLSSSLLVQNLNASSSLVVLDNGFVGIGTISPSASLHVAGTTLLSSSFNTAISGSTLKVQGSGSTQPIFTVVGSQGELFSITDSLSGSLFSVNDISGLPIMEVFSDNTILLGNYQAPTLYTTNKIASTITGSNVIYSLPTSSYDGVFIDYTVKSGSNARAGNFAAIWSGTAVNYMDNSTTDFGSTTGMVLSGSISGSNLVIFASGSSAGWTFKGIIKAI